MRISIVILLLFASNVFGQNPNEHIPLGSLNKRYLEHLIKVGIDSVRAAHGLNKLANDSVLYEASKGHVEYLKKTRKTTHYQYENPSLKSPEDRVLKSGGKNYVVAENVAKTYAHKLMKNGKKSLNLDHTYQEVANRFVINWVNSPQHYANIIDPRFEVTGIAVEEDSARKEIKAVQLFAEVQFKYSFPEDKKLFPYSKYQSPVLVSSFEGIPRQRIDSKFEWGIRSADDSLVFCANCNDPIDTNVYKDKLLIKGRRIVFHSPNVEMMYLILDTWRSGLAVELVPYKPYDCNNPEYYTLPSRRNQQNMFNGTVLKPVYRKDLKRGFKRGKYTWWSRLKKKGQPIYFEYTLGKLPRDLEGYVEANVLVIKNKKLCRVMHFSDVCGNEMEEFYDIPYMTKLNTYQYGVNPELTEIEFVIPFEQGKFRYDYDDIKPLIDSVSSETFSVVAADVYAYSSLEGSKTMNLALQNKRARSVIRALEENQRSEIIANIRTAENWDMFRDQIKRMPELFALKGLSDQQIRERLSDAAYARSIEHVLSEQRYALVKLKVQVDPTKDGLGEFLIAEFERHLDTVQNEVKTVGMSRKARNNIDTMASIQWYMYHSIKNGKVDSTFFEKLEVPQKVDYARLIKDHLWYDLDIHGSGAGNLIWERNFYNQLNRLDRLGISSFEIRYDVMNYLVRNWKKMPPYGGDVDRLGTNIAGLQALAKTDSVRKHTDELMINYHFANANYRHFTNNTGEPDKLRASMEAIHDYYMDIDHTAEEAWQLGSFFTWGEQEDLAYNILAQKVNEENVNHKLLMLYTKLLFSHIEEYHDTAYQEFVMETSETLTNDEWCSMFVGPCNISFQIFDYEPLKNLYCRKCAEKANYAEKPEEWVDGSPINEKKY